ncbi:TetR family transcriptional regulator [Micromonospora sp. ATCC 39149]|nr:TetR family transcriptional regulator [Micromonospora sp. ATCC 39149]
MARTRDLAQQQAALSSATWAVLAERGIAGLTVRAVAERVGCTSGLVFHTFPSKQALLAHARQTLFERAAARVDAVERQGGTPAEVLENVMLTLLALDRDGAEEARVWISFLAAAPASPELADHHLAGNRPWCRA